MLPRQLHTSLCHFSLLFSLLIIFFQSQCFSQGASTVADNGFESLSASATAAREAGRSEDALRDYQHAVELRPDWEEGWWYLGTLQYDADHFAEAIPAFQKIVALDPSLGSAWNFLGLCEFETHDYTNSLEHLQKGQSTRSDDPEISRVAKYHLALLLIRSGAFEKGAEILNGADSDRQAEQVKIALGLSLLRVPLLPQEIDPSQEALLHAAGETAAIEAEGNPVKALESFEPLVKMSPDAPYLHYSYGLALAAYGKNDEALAQQRAELKNSSESALPQIAISGLELRLKHPQAALRAAEIAVRLDPESQTARRALAQSEEALGRKDLAAENLRKSKALLPEKPKREARLIQLYIRPASAIVAGGSPYSHSGSASGNFDEVSKQAAAAQAAGDKEGAIQAYQEALHLNPAWDDGRWQLAMLCYEQGRYPEAVSNLKTWIERKPNDGTAWAVMGLSEFELQNYGNSLIHLQRGHDLGFGGTTNAVQLATYHLGILLNRNAQFESATDILAPAAESGALAKEVRFAMGMSLLRMPLFPNEVEESKTNLVENAGEASVLLQRSKYDDALPLLQTLIQKNPDVPFLHYAYGVALSSLSQYDDAEAQFRNEAVISPNSELPQVRLASLALRKHEAANALPAAVKAVKLAPDSGEAHYMLGRTYLELGQEDNALRELELASKIAPSSPEVHFNLAKAYAKEKLPDKEAQERAIFIHLEEIAQQQAASRGSQSYGGTRDTTDFSVSRSEPAVPNR
jgi:tetratricopeptide (TPR) repeat protein